VPNDRRIFLAIIRARIRAARLAHNLSQDEVAAAAGLETRTYQHLENPAPSRKFNPRLETLLDVAGALGVGLADLVREPNTEDLKTLEKPVPIQRQGRKRQPRGSHS
jgi:transcriptional regulator with XRE-family HTH domain